MDKFVDMVVAVAVSLLSHVFVMPWMVACEVPLSMGFPRQEYCSGLPFPPPGDLPDPGIESLFPALTGNSLPLNLQGSPSYSVVASLF